MWLSRMVSFVGPILFHWITTSCHCYFTAAHIQVLHYLRGFRVNWRVMFLFKVKTDFVSLCSFLMIFTRYKHVKSMMSDKNFGGAENANLISNFEKKYNLMTFFKTKPDHLENRSNTVSLYQTCIMIMTITAISAVDFKMFPPRFRKSKTFGLSLVSFRLIIPNNSYFRWTLVSR